eukprot:15441059-Alexandrium_andersonii.AAC.1
MTCRDLGNTASAPGPSEIPLSMRVGRQPSDRRTVPVGRAPSCSTSQRAYPREVQGVVAPAAPTSVLI